MKSHFRVKKREIMKSILINIKYKQNYTLTKAQEMKRKKLELKAHKMLFQLEFFYRMCKHHL